MYYHLRVDTPTVEFATERLCSCLEQPKYYAVREISNKGKSHIHMLIYLEIDEVQPLRCYMGVTYKNALKKHDYWEKTYKDSKKIQVYSLQKVRNPEKIWTYIHKDTDENDIPATSNWVQDDWDSLIEKKKEEKKAEEDKEKKEIDAFWIQYNENIETENGSNGTVLYACYMYALERFYEKFGDKIEGFRSKFLKSAYKHKVIDFNTFMNKMYRL